MGEDGDVDEDEDEDETVEEDDDDGGNVDTVDEMNSESTESEVNCSKKRRVKFTLSSTEDEEAESATAEENQEDGDTPAAPTSGEDTTEGSTGSPMKIRTCDAFSKARKKASLKRKQASEFSSDDTTDTGVEVSENEDENQQEEHEQSEGSPPKQPKYSSDDDIASDLADSLTPEERAFLGLTSGVPDDAEDDDDRIAAKQMTPVSGKNFKVFSSPQVMVVEATSDETAPKKKRKMTASERLKRKLVDKLDKKHKKGPRMTTNKKKTGSRYYETTNVKNKNRNTPGT